MTPLSSWPINIPAIVTQLQYQAEWQYAVARETFLMATCPAHLIQAGKHQKRAAVTSASARAYLGIE
jgi:hypothetical protein